MSELKASAAAARRLRAQAEPYLVATVIRVRGSAYRRPGARMVATEAQWVAGSISGGCLERDVLNKGFWRTRGEVAVLVTHDEALDERAGSGCLGEIDILLERIDPRHADRGGGSPRPYADALEFVEACIARELPGAIATVFASTRPDVPVGARLTVLAGEETHHGLDASELRTALRAHAAELLAGYAAASRGAQPSSPQSLCVHVGGVEALIERVVPPVHLFVFGTGHDADPVVAFAQQLGWSVSVWDAQPRLSARERMRAVDHYLTGGLSDAVARLDASAIPAAIVMGHHYAQDQSVLSALLGSRARYIGVLGPRTRTDRMLSDCREQGVQLDESVLARIHAPVGLSLGAETPAEIALAILAEAQAALTDSPARALRNLGGPIHPGPATPEDAASGGARALGAHAS